MIDNGQDSGYQSNFGRVPYEETHFEEKDENNFVSMGFLSTDRTRFAERYKTFIGFTMNHTLYITVSV